MIRLGLLTARMHAWAYVHHHVAAAYDRSIRDVIHAREHLAR